MRSEHCLSGWETVCADAQFGGYTKNGGFAEYTLADAAYVAHIPAGLSAQAAAPINRVFERLDRGEVASRVVLDFTPS